MIVHHVPVFHSLLRSFPVSPFNPVPFPLSAYPRVSTPRGSAASRAVRRALPAPPPKQTARGSASRWYGRTQRHDYQGESKNPARVRKRSRLLLRTAWPKTGSTGKHSGLTFDYQLELPRQACVSPVSVAGSNQIWEALAAPTPRLLGKVRPADFDALAVNPLLHARRHPNKDIRWRYPDRFPYRVIYDARSDSACRHASLKSQFAISRYLTLRPLAGT